MSPGEGGAPATEAGGAGTHAAERERRGRRVLSFLGRHVAEIYIAVVAVGTLVALRAQGLAYGWNTIAYVFGGQALQIPFLVAEGLALQVLARALRPRRILEYGRSLLSGRWWASTVVIWTSSILILYSYVWLKVSIPLVRTELYDAELWRLDRWLHFGVSPSIFAIELSAGTALPPLLDRWYALWMATIPLAFAYVYASTDDRLRRNFLLANGLLWTVGSWIYLLLPAVGPCYASPEILEPIRHQLPLAMESQGGLWQNYGRLIRSRSGGLLDWFQPEFGVAAMPSLHVAAHWLFALWSRRYAPRLFLPWAVATGLTLLGSLVTGWHYAVDGYAGLLLAWGAVRLADRLQPAPRAAPTDEARGSARPPAPA